jgi:hypothetical protein
MNRPEDDVVVDIAEKMREARLRWMDRHVIRRDEGEMVRDIVKYKNASS